ncbi:putative Ig domain-containing protein, partial [Vibrio fortis]
ITVIPNTRPKIVGTTEPVELTLGEAWRPFNVSDKFQDAEGDDMTFTMVVVGGEGNNGLSIDSLTGLITGEPEIAGGFTYHIFATDEHGARSYPLTFEVSVLTDNQPPVVDEGELSNLQSTMNTWMLTEGESLTDTLDVSALFTDHDGDTLSYKVETTLSTVARTGFNALVDDEGVVSFTGLIPRSAAAGAETLTILANDGVNGDWASATLSFPIIEEAPLPPVDGHPLEDHTWHFLEWGSDDGSDSGVNEATRVWCDSVRFSEGKVYFNQRSLDNLQSCGEADQPETSSSYVVKDDVIEWSMSWEDEEDGLVSETIQLRIAQDADDLGQGA